MPSCPRNKGIVTYYSSSEDSLQCKTVSKAFVAHIYTKHKPLLLAMPAAVRLLVLIFAFPNNDSVTSLNQSLVFWRHQANTREPVTLRDCTRSIHMSRVLQIREKAAAASKVTDGRDR